MTVAEERAYALRLRYPELKRLVDSRGYGLFAQAVFFVLTLIGVFVFYAFTERELATAAICLVLAEFLILGRKWFFTGVEAALWIGGLIAALKALPNSGAPEAKLLLAAAFAIAGLRVRQPLFGAIAAYHLTDYLEARFDLGTVAALIVGAAAVTALFRTWRRPSTEWLLALLAIAMPVAAEVHADPRWRVVTVGLYAAYASLAFLSAVAKRHHALFAAAGAASILLGWKLHQIFEPRPEVTFAIAGTLLLAGSLAASRRLRGNTRGLVLTPVAVTDAGEAMETIGALAAASLQPSAGNPPERREEGGGSFGGAGATGDY